MNNFISGLLIASTAGYLILVIITIFYIRKQIRQEYEELKNKEANLIHSKHAVEQRLLEIEHSIERVFLSYEFVREIAPLQNRDSLMSIFKEKIYSLGQVKNIIFSSHPNTGFLNYEIKTEPPTWLCLQTNSESVKEHLPTLIYQLNICLERIKLYNKLKEMSIHDNLTKVFNRRYFMERFYGEIERAKKFSFPLSLLMIDIDFFKKINDNYGHLVGDMVLKNVALTIKNAIRDIDFIARIGGEEFIVVLTETNKESAIAVANRILKKIADKTIRAFDENLKITVSIGVASYPENTNYSDMLLEIADRAMYKAKELGRNRVEYF